MIQKEAVVTSLVEATICVNMTLNLTGEATRQLLRPVNPNATWGKEEETASSCPVERAEEAVAGKPHNT